jgi:hypothetical protein
MGDKPRLFARVFFDLIINGFNLFVIGLPRHINSPVLQICANNTGDMLRLMQQMDYSLCVFAVRFLTLGNPSSILHDLFPNYHSLTRTSGNQKDSNTKGTKGHEVNPFRFPFVYVVSFVFEVFFTRVTHDENSCTKSKKFTCKRLIPNP